VIPAALVAVVVVALLHVWFFILESFLWQTPLGLKALKMTAEQAAATAVLAKNQGLYNAFLAAGLAWGVSPWAKDPVGVQTFFLGCVVVAGVVGAVTASRAILVLQALPGALALTLVLLA
jgi:putative membrane protein